MNQTESMQTSSTKPSTMPKRDGDVLSPKPSYGESQPLASPVLSPSSTDTVPSVYQLTFSKPREITSGESKGRTDRMRVLRMMALDFVLQCSHYLSYLPFHSFPSPSKELIPLKCVQVKRMRNIHSTRIFMSTGPDVVETSLPRPTKLKRGSFQHFSIKIPLLVS